MAPVDDETRTHPRIRERRAEVHGQSVRSRQRKVIAFAAAVLVVLLAAASTQSALLDVDEVRIVGAGRTSPDYLRQVAGVELGTPLLGLDTGAIEQRLVALPEVQTVEASSSWSGVVTVEINERMPVARIDTAEGTVVVAGDGVVLDVIDRLPPGPLDDPSGVLDDSSDAISDDDTVVEFVPLAPEIEALTDVAGAMFSTQRGEEIPQVLDEAILVAASLPSDIAAITERVEITVDSLYLRAVGGGRISLGDARDLEEKFGAIRAFLAQVDLSCLNELNVRAPSVPVITRSTNC